MALPNELNPVDELIRLERFTGADPEAAKEAFVQLSSRIDRFLYRLLPGMLPDIRDREDVIAMVKEKLYAKRSEFHVQSVGQWWAYVATTGKRCAWDHAKKSDTLPLEEDLPVADIEAIGNVAGISHLRSRLYRAADEFWLNVPADMPEVERRRRLLAAQLFYLNGARHEEVREILGRNKPIDRETLDCWLADRAVLMDLAYHELYMENEALICLLLRPECPLTTKELDCWARAARKGSSKPPAGWTWPEIAIAIWRFRNGLLADKIQQISNFDEADIQAALDKCVAMLPFESIAVEIQESLAKRHARFNPLATDEIWRRLVFQYATAHELPHKQILERTEPAARAAGKTLTAAMLNGWLSSGRLVTQLATYTRRRLPNDES